MKQITKTNNPRTTLSAVPGKLELKLGTDIQHEKVRPFLDILDDMLSRMTEQTKPFYGHFSFTRDKVEITWSHKEESPEVFDLTYARKL